MIRKIRLQGLLSFDDMELELRNVNVLIGPNGSGKSNLIEALSLLQAAPVDIGGPIRQGGGIDEWLWKGGAAGRPAVLDVGLDPLGRAGNRDLRYRLRLHSASGRHVITEEALETEPRWDDDREPYIFFQVRDGEGVINIKTRQDNKEESQKKPPRRLSRETLTPGQSVLHERRDADLYPEITELARRFGAIKLYKEWSTGRITPPRTAQRADLLFDFLAEDASNLALVVNDFERTGEARDIEDEFKRFFERFRRFTVQIFSNQVQLYMHEEGLRLPIPATRWSDGMLRYLSLLCILHHPNPPGLICIDEPELGLHPDIIPHLARLIRSAAEHTQLIIATHSKDLIDEFTDDPGSVVVCERGPTGSSTMERLDEERLAKWLEHYSLGELWESGEIGGNPY